MFHIGHLKLLKRISKKGDELIVAISDDAFNEGKGKKVMIPFKQLAKKFSGKVGKSLLDQIEKS